MKTPCLSVLTLVVCVCSAVCYPTKPLNERSTELAWQAWLLVDQNNRQGDLGVLRRRITPKSVFIAPTFSPDSLPACAEGYKSDAMGRCVKIIKIDEAAHLDFLLQRLNAQFADYEEEPDDVPTPGPFQLNIPLVDDEKGFDNETDVAIVVAPSTGHEKGASVKLDVKRNDRDKFNVENVAAILGVKPEDVETTTIAELTTQMETTTAATTRGADPTTEATTVAETEAPSGGDALFFKLRI